MKRLVGVALLLSAVVTGCTSTNAPVMSPVTSVTPSTMSVTQAADAYISAVCPANVASLANHAAFQAGDLSQILSTAKVWLAANRETALQLDNPTAPWPEIAKDDIAGVRDDLLTQSSAIDAVTRADDLQAARSVVFPQFGPSSQLVRLHLGLPSDTSSGC